MASIRARVNKNGKKSFYVRIRRKGLLECQTFPTITKAREYIQSTEAAMREGRYTYHVEAKKHTLGETIDRYIQDVLPNKPKSYRKQHTQLIWWKSKIGHLSLFDITPPRIAEQRDALHGEKKHTSSYVFFSSRCEYGPASIRHAWEDAVRVARIDDFRFHDLRHCFATEMAAQGVSPVQLRFLMGHKSFSMTARYTHMEEETMREDVEKMARKVFGKNG